MDRPVDEQLRAHPCPSCGRHTLVLELRPTLVARPVGTWSLAGAQDKTSAYERDWPFAVCSTDDCDFETRAQVVDR